MFKTNLLESLVGPLIIALAVAVAIIAFSALHSGGSLSGEGDAPAAAPPPAESSARETDLATRVRDLTPKAKLQHIKGIKTVAPAVPPPVTRAENKIVEYELTVRETSALIAPNLKYLSLWTFDGVVPGPVMRVKVGDVVRFTLNNASSSVTNHNIDFHFISGACGGCVDTRVKPGESRTIDARALYPGVFMYHCAYSQMGNVAAVHIANGMYGFLIVDPETPLPPVSHEYMLVEGEFYVEKASKGAGICDYDDLVNEKPTYYFFNGKHADLNPPLVLNVNERVRLYVGRGGVNGTCAFHVIGTVFDKVYPDGDLLDPPIERGVQTVNVPVGGGTVVEFVPLVPGTLTAVDHNLSRVYFKGLGQVFEVRGAPNPEIYERFGESSGEACPTSPSTSQPSHHH